MAGSQRRVVLKCSCTRHTPHSDFGRMLPRDERVLGCSVRLSGPALAAQGSGERGRRRDRGNSRKKQVTPIPCMFIEHLICAVPDPGHAERGPEDQSLADSGPGLMTLHSGARPQSNEDRPGPLSALRDATPESFSDFLLMTFSHVRLLSIHALSRASPGDRRSEHKRQVFETETPQVGGGLHTHSFQHLP